jgi:hypothetical protein
MGYEVIALEMALRFDDEAMEGAGAVAAKFRPPGK